MILQSVQRFAQLADTPSEEINRLLSLSEGGGCDTPETNTLLPSSQELYDLEQYMRTHLSFQPTPQPFDEPSSRQSPAARSSEGVVVDKPPPRTVFRDQSNTSRHQPPRTSSTKKKMQKQKARDPTPCKPPQHVLPKLPVGLPSFVQRQLSQDDLAGLHWVPSPVGASSSSMRRNHSSLIVELSHEEEEEEQAHEDEDTLDEFALSYTNSPKKSPPRTVTIIPMEPDQAQSPVHDASFLLLGRTDELLLRKPQAVSNEPESERVAVVEKDDDDEQPPEDLYFLFPPEENTNNNKANVTTANRPSRLSFHLSSTPNAMLVDSQLQELELKRPKTPQDARQWLQTAVVALQEARSEREAARQWARDMKEAVQKWTTEQQRLVQLEASSHLCDTLSRLETQIVDLKSLFHNHHERQDSSQSHLHDLLQQQQSTLQELFDQFSQTTGPLVSPTTTATSPPGRVAGLSRQSMDGSTASNRVQRPLPHGAGRLVVYASGVEKEVHKDGTTVVRFPNGDVETTLPDDKKTVAYYHAAEQVMQITQPDRSVLLEYPNGQVERHYVDGSKVILFPNGQKVKLDPSGVLQGY